MLRSEHCDKIIAKCKLMLSLAEKEPVSFMDSAISAYKTTIISINVLRAIHMRSNDVYLLTSNELDEIIKAWPENLL